MDRDEFMELVYETFADEPDNVLANGIIEAADAYVEHEKTQLSQEGTTSDTISRQAAIEAINTWPKFGCDEHGRIVPWNENYVPYVHLEDVITAITKLPPAPKAEIVRCKDCKWWTKQEDSMQGRCELLGMYPTGGWFCGNAKMEVEYDEP